MKLVSLSALSQAVTTSRQQIAAIVICISLILEVVFRIAIHHIPINQQAAVIQVVITINRQQEAIRHRTIAVQRNVLLETSSSKKSNTYDSYDDGYDDIYMDGDYDYVRYDRDSDYADGVDDAMDEFDEDW